MQQDMDEMDGHQTILIGPRLTRPLCPPVKEELRHRRSLIEKVMTPMRRIENSLRLNLRKTLISLSALIGTRQLDEKVLST